MEGMEREGVDIVGCRDGKCRGGGCQERRCRDRGGGVLRWMVEMECVRIRRGPRWKVLGSRNVSIDKSLQNVKTR